MKPLFWLVAGALSGLAQGLWLPFGISRRSLSSASSSVSVSTWTILSLRRTCRTDDTVCTYQILTLMGDRPSSCSITVDASSASTASVARVPCLGDSSRAPQLTASLTVQSGMVQVGLADERGARGAVYEFEQAVLSAGQRVGPQTVQAVVLGAEKTQHTVSGLDERAGGNKTVEALEQAGVWSVLNASRYYNADFKVVIVEFTLYAQDYDGLRCVVVATVPEDVNWKTFSFYSHNCAPDVLWHVSWGYNPRRDSGVMTVMNPDGTRAAWFGWDNINSNTKLQDVGPNDTQQVTQTQTQTQLQTGA